MLHGAALAEQERLAIVYHAAVDADPTDLAGEAAIFDLRAAVHDYPQSGILGDSSLRTPSCIHITLAPMAMASRATSGAASGVRNMSTTSTGSSMSESE